MRKGDSGFSLIELVVTITILGSISAAVGEAVIIGLRTTDVANSRLGESREAQLAAAWFATDVQSANQVFAGAEAGCEPAAEAGWARTPLVHLKSMDATVEKNVSYAAESSTSGGRRLRRTSCVSSTVVSHIVADEIAAAPVLACDDGTCSSPRTMTIRLVGGGGYRYELAGTRRVVASQP